METNEPFRTGDAVKHKPSGETWLVAYCERGYVCCCGWPESLAPVADCELHRKGTDAECEELLQLMGRPGREFDSRAAYARRVFEKRNQMNSGAGPAAQSAVAGVGGAVPLLMEGTES